MLIIVTFSKSELKNGNYSVADTCPDGEIPVKERVNIFTSEQLERLNSILDHPLETERVSRYNLMQDNLYKKNPHEWFSNDEEKKKNQKRENEKYNQEYDDGEFLDLFLTDKHGSNTKFIVDSDLLFNFMTEMNGLGSYLKYEVKGTVKDVPTMKKNSESKVLNKLLSLEENLNNFTQAKQFNTKVGVHISDLGLLNVKEVDVLYSPCTDTLQDWLDKGWRIIAVCPQTDQRRPDYIVGKNTPVNGRKRRSID